jgi:hypothetical protein
MRILNLIRERSCENQTWIDTFSVEDYIQDPIAALRAAVQEFLTTSAGQRAVNYTCYDFNWGDAITYVPEIIWNKHGLYFNLNICSIDYKVNQDEVLCGERPDDDQEEADSI